MPRKKAEVEPVYSFHHILKDTEARAISTLQVRDAHGEPLENFEPIVKMDTIKQWLIAKGKPGEFSIVGLDATERRLPGATLCKIRPEDVVSKDGMVDENFFYYQAQQEQLSDERKRLERMQRDLLQQQETFQAGVQAQRDSAVSEQTQMMLGFMRAEKEADRERRDTGEAMRMQHEERMTRLEQSFSERQSMLEEKYRKADAERDERLQRELVKIEADKARLTTQVERERQELHERAMTIIREEADRRAVEAERVHNTEMQQLQEKTKSQFEMQQQMMELRMLEKETELKQQFKPDFYAHLSENAMKAVSKKAVDRIVEAEFPEESGVEKVFKQVSSLLQQIDGKFPNLAAVVGKAANQVGTAFPAQGGGVSVGSQLEGSISEDASIDLDDFDVGDVGVSVVENEDIVDQEEEKDSDLFPTELED